MTTQTPPPADDATEFRIDRLGTDGDGTAATTAGPVFIPFALPGERVLASSAAARRARLVSVLDRSPDRVVPPCTLFGRCGGCAVQHLSPDAVLSWKVDLVAAALRRAGLPLPDRIATHQSPPNTRRRMDLALKRSADGLDLGLHERGSTTVIDMRECHVLRPDLHALVRAAVPVLFRLRGLRERGSLLVNGLSDGTDLLLRTDAPLERADRAALAAYAIAHAVPRLSWTLEGARGAATEPPETIAQHESPKHRFGDATLFPPPGAFFQATADGEDAIRAAVLDGLPRRLNRSARLVELHAGLGTLSFALSERGPLAAFEGDPAAAAALFRAAAGRRIVATRRDLQRQPLQPAELADAACVVLDPPFGGAAAQIAPLAASAVPRVIYVSCDPAALSRDAAVLAAAGFTLSALTVIDQFLWSARVESVCVFDRPRRPTRPTAGGAPAVLKRGSFPRSRSGPSRSGS